MKQFTEEELGSIKAIRELIGEDIDHYEALEVYEEIMEQLGAIKAR